MSALRAIRCSTQRNEPWANGRGSTRVVLREPDASEWRVRVSVATIADPGPFSELPGTQRILIPLDAPIVLRFPNGRELAVQRMQQVHFEGTPRAYSAAARGIDP
jgi:environmental stress-induced protein Ves